MHEQLRAILQRDPIRHANLLNFADRYGIESFSIRGESVLARGTSDHTWAYLVPASEAEGPPLLDELTREDHYLVGVDAWLLELLPERFEIEWTLRCRKLAWPKDRQPEPPSLPVRPLVPGDADFIYGHSDYQAYTDIPYILDQIQRGVGGGIQGPDGSLAAWALTHDDGAIGFLHVLEPFRRLGYGAALTQWMIRRVLDTGRVPFVHIEATNGKSLGLALKTGFLPAGEIWWAKGNLR